MAEILTIESESVLQESLDIIRGSFRTVADEFGLTPENCPAHPSFVTREQLEALRDKGLVFFALYEAGQQAGFVAVERGNEGLYYVEKLAVLPGNRHRGFGRALMEHAASFVAGCGGKAISVALIDESSMLKAWYREQGFEETGTKRFEHLPFTVCFMEKRLP